MNIKTYDSAGKATGEQDFPIATFEGIEASQALKDIIVTYQANARQGTHSTKTRGEVSGGGKKPWRQKGTGRARAGSTRSPLWVGGGTTFGPKPRSYRKKSTQSTRRTTLSRALFDRVSQNDVLVVDSLALDGKTKTASALLKQLGLAGPVLVVDQKFDAAAVRSLRNIPTVSLGGAAEVNALHLSDFQKIVFTRKGLETLLARTA